MPIAYVYRLLKGWTAAADQRAVDYPRWIGQRVRERRREYPLPPRGRRPSFEVLTLVYNTDPAILRETAQSVLAQDYPDFRWVVWDNGSDRLDTRDLLWQLQADARVVVRRSDWNLGITRGHREALRFCSADYVALLDHDDRLYPDALRIAACVLDRHRRPPLLYSDEDKIDAAGTPFCPFFKPDWSPALLQSTGYTCHLTVFRRDLAGPLGLFSDPRVEGAQDWDVALRFLDARYVGVHVPEVLYSWRVLPESTAARGAAAKPYVLAGQRACLEAALARRRLGEAFRIVPNPLFPAVDGHWRLERVRAELPPVEVVIGPGPGEEGDAPAAVLNRLVAESTSPFFACIPPGVVRLAPRWLHEAITQLELNPDAALVGGRVLDRHDRVVAGPLTLGLGGLVGTAGAGGPGDDIGYFGLSLSPRNVSAVCRVPWVARRELLAEWGFDEQAFPEHYAEVDLCLRLLAAGRQVIYSPHIVGWVSAEALHRDPAAEEAEAARLVERHGTRLADDPYYSPRAALRPEHAYQPASAAERQAALRALVPPAAGRRLSA